MASIRPIFQPFKKQESIKSIFLGIDFGTSYTKVSYSYAPANVQQIHTLKWNRDFFKQSVLYFKDGYLYFDKPSDDCAEIKYFKYSIVEKKLQNNRQKTQCNFEELCCVFFLTQVITRSLKNIFDSLKITDSSDIKISVNMGVPLENFYEEKNKNNKNLYLEMLENAVTLAGGSKVRASIPVNQVLLSNLDKVYSEVLCKKAFLNWNVNVFPELAAELLLYHESKLIPEGIYAIIDIGGGTVDMAVFQKYSVNNHPCMYCLRQKVLPLGVETLTKDNQSLKTYQETFLEMFTESKNFADVHYEDYKYVDVFFLGGGATDSWYMEGIQTVSTRLIRAGIPKLRFKNKLKDFIKSEESLLEKNQRLIISQMLARLPTDITDVQGYPNWYEAELKDRIIREQEEKKQRTEERANKWYEIAKDNGWDDIG